MKYVLIVTSLSAPIEDANIESIQVYPSKLTALAAQEAIGKRMRRERAPGTVRVCRLADFELPLRYVASVSTLSSGSYFLNIDSDETYEPLEQRRFPGLGNGVDYI